MNFDAIFCNISRCVVRHCSLQVIKTEHFFSYFNNNNDDNPLFCETNIFVIGHLNFNDLFNGKSVFFSSKVEMIFIQHLLKIETKSSDS